MDSNKTINSKKFEFSKKYYKNFITNNALQSGSM